MLSCDDDDYPFSEVPSVVLNSFRTEYPDATDAEFSKEGENYEVEFEIAGNDNAALINPSGNILKEKKEIPWDSIPAEVREKLDNEYGKKDIKDPELVRTGEEIHYQAEVERFLTDEKVVLDKTGKQDSGLDFWK